jgi:hypothetical protein
MVAISLALVAAMIGAAGCGGSGVAEGATVRVYLGVDLCADAQWELAGPVGESSNLEIEALCVRPAESGGHLSLATIGANARRATEDSAAIAFVESRGPANRFARTIVEEAGIAYVVDDSGSSAAKRIVKAVEEAGSGSLRDGVRDALEEGS